MLESPIVPCFVRAPTDNDAGGSGGTAHAARWLQLGLDRLTITDAKLELLESSSDRIVAKVRLTNTLFPSCKQMKWHAAA